MSCKTIQRAKRTRKIKTEEVAAIVKNDVVTVTVGGAAAQDAATIFFICDHDVRAKRAMEILLKVQSRSGVSAEDKNLICILMAAHCGELPRPPEFPRPLEGTMFE